MRKRRRFPIPLVLVVAACGGSDKTPVDAAAPDAPGVIIDASADAPPAPVMITISGTALERTATGNVPVSGATITGYRNDNDATPVATTTSGADGSYTLTVATGGLALDGYLKATKEGLKDTYLYPPAPLAANATAPVNMVSPTTYGLISLIAGGNQQAGNGLIAMVVVSGATADSMPVEGATAPDGTAFAFNVPPNMNVVVMASKTGSTFTAHGLKAWPDQFTTTLITP
jgi:hypothetical protein